MWDNLWDNCEIDIIHVNDFNKIGWQMAEREGFEPPVELPPRRISSAVHSTTLPPLREVRGRGRPVDTRRLMA